jgi:hypothetical protein
LSILKHLKYSQVFNQSSMLNNLKELKTAKIYLM